MPNRRAALEDWFLIGLFTGSRLTEWAQEAYNKNPESAKRNMYGDIAAFCLNDIRAQTESKALLFGADILSVPRVQLIKIWINI